MAVDRIEKEGEALGALSAAVPAPNLQHQPHTADYTLAPVALRPCRLALAQASSVFVAMWHGSTREALEQQVRLPELRVPCLWAHVL